MEVMKTRSRHLVLLVVMRHYAGISDSLRIRFISSRIRIRVVLLVKWVLMLMLVLIVILVPMHGIRSRVLPVGNRMMNVWVAAGASICRSVTRRIRDLDSALYDLMNFRVPWVSLAVVNCRRAVVRSHGNWRITGRGSHVMLLLMHQKVRMMLRRTNV